MTSSTQIDRAIGSLLVVLTLVVAAHEWGLPLPAWLPAGLAGLTLTLLAAGAPPGRLAFLAVGLGLTLWLALTRPDWEEVTLAAFGSAAFIGAFFTALATLRNVAQTSPSIRAAGRFLAAQPPGRRYAALTAGGHLFALLLNYGAIALLGTLASASMRDEADPEIRRIRTRRMLLAIQRGFIASLPWSPLGFAMAVTTAVVPGASWIGAVWPGLGSALIIAGLGWTLDSIFKPRLTGPRPPPQKPEGSWALMLPFLALLAGLAVTVSFLYVALDIRVVGVVMVVVPLIAVSWALIQARPGPSATPGRTRAREFAWRDLPGYRNEVLLLMMAGYIGTVGAPLLKPLVLNSGFDPLLLPTWAVLVALVWLIPLLGQIGMNPILAVTLIAPLIPEASALGVSPSAVVAAIAAGWAISGASSPFTATTLLIGSFANVSAVHVGVKWNGAYTVIAATCLSAWVLIYGYWIG